MSITNRFRHSNTYTKLQECIDFNDFNDTTKSVYNIALKLSISEEVSIKPRSGRFHVGPVHMEPMEPGLTRVIRLIKLLTRL